MRTSEESHAFDGVFLSTCSEVLMTESGHSLLRRSVTSQSGEQFPPGERVRKQCTHGLLAQTSSDNAREMKRHARKCSGEDKIFRCSWVGHDRSCRGVCSGQPRYPGCHDAWVSGLALTTAATSAHAQ